MTATKEATETKEVKEPQEKMEVEEEEEEGLMADVKKCPQMKSQPGLDY